jgi:hypothetical protein
MSARIYKPAKTAMQSGQAKTHEWVVEFEPQAAQEPDPLMGWAGSADTERQLMLRFAGEAEAIAYCRKRGIAYACEAPHGSTLKPKSYADNFRYNRVR